MSGNLPPLRKALVIDDDTGNLGVLNILLTRAGYQVLSVAEGQAGMALADGTFALAFIDMRLPDVFGAEVVAAVRSTGPDTFIIAATMDDDPKTMHAVYDAGCDLFLVKPYDMPQVMQILQNAQRGRRWLADRLGVREYIGR